MKLIRVFIAIAIIGSLTISCKNTTKGAKEDLKDAVEKAEETADEAANEIKEATEAAAEDVKEAVEEVQDAANEVVESVGIKVNYPKDIALQNEVNNAILLMGKENPNVKKMFDNTYGYAVFPKITKAGLGVGGAGGNGLVFVKNKVIGSAKLMQATIGLQAGGQQYSEYIFFENKAAMDRFKNDKLKFAAEYSAVAIDKAVSDNIDYQDGVAVYTHSNKGVMAEASVGTQKFKYTDGIK